MSMSYKIVVDSCCELTEEMEKTGLFESIPFTIQVGDKFIVDDENFNQADFLKKVAECPECPKTSCPSPERYVESYACDADRVYVITITAELSGSYNSAVLGKNLYHEEHGKKDIYVFNSRSASVGETLIALKIIECEKAEMSFEETIEAVEAYISEQGTHFVLENLETLKKNGRLTGVKSLVATALNIKPVMAATPQGVICQKGQARGIKKALVKMVEIALEDVKNPGEKIVGITNCNCRERALDVRAMIEKKVKFKDVIIVDSKGLSTTYANDGGIILVV